MIIPLLMFLLPSPVFPLPSPSIILGDHIPGMLHQMMPTSHYQGDDGGVENCHKVEKVEFREECEPYKEETCYTQNMEQCDVEEVKNCTTVIETEMEKACFSVKELMCSLEEIVHQQVVEETYQVMRCFTATDRVCDTTYHIDYLDKDDYQCLSVEAPNCYQQEQTIVDVTCTDTIEFQCDKQIKNEYGEKEVVCARFPKKECYDVPRKVLVEVCDRDVYDYCEKFTNTVPLPIEGQNCHFEPRKICEVEEKSRPKQAKMYSYTKDCKKVDRTVCSQVERKVIQPVCVNEERLKCSYEPEVKCEEEYKVYCHEVEHVVVEDVCDKKFKTDYI